MSGVDVDRMRFHADHGCHEDERHALLYAAADEIERLRDWKTEAMLVLGQWDRVHEALGAPGPLGSRKSESSLLAVVRLRADLAKYEALVAQLREWTTLGNEAFVGAAPSMAKLLLARHGLDGDA